MRCRWLAEVLDPRPAEDRVKAVSRDEPERVTSRVGATAAAPDGRAYAGARMSEGRLPSLTVAELLRALGCGGWYVKRQGGRHVILTHRERGGRVTIPRHPSQTLKPRTLQSILDQAGLTAEQLRGLL
jgi:mRNA interferase HicA